MSFCDASKSYRVYHGSERERWKRLGRTWYAKGQMISSGLREVVCCLYPESTQRVIVALWTRDIDFIVAIRQQCTRYLIAIVFVFYSVRS